MNTNAVIHHALLWVYSWVKLAQAMVEILSLGFYYPTWEMSFLVWESKRNLNFLKTKGV